MRPGVKRTAPEPIRNLKHRKYLSMAKKVQKVPTAPADWRAESLRLTAFLRSPTDKLDVGSWQEFLGDEPKSSESRPREGLVLEGGPCEQGWLTLEGSPIRVDWRLGINPEGRETLSEIPSLGDFESVQGQFGVLMKRWLKKSPPLNRLAFGAILNLPVKNLTEGYRLLGRYLPKVEIDPKKSRDLFYQINRRRPSKSGIKSLEINRLTKWSVVQLRAGIVDLSAGHGKFMETAEPLVACRLELDINTAPEFKSALKKTKLSKLFDELVELGMEIAHKGDIA